MNKKPIYVDGVRYESMVEARIALGITISRLLTGINKHRQIYIHGKKHSVSWEPPVPEEEKPEIKAIIKDRMLLRRTAALLRYPSGQSPLNNGNIQWH
jgi:hypothetical protein